MFGPGPKDPTFELYLVILNHYLHMAPEQLDWFIKSCRCVDCLHLKDPLGSFEDSRGISPVPGFYGPLGLNGAKPQCYA
jgi:hypothetical protein